MINNLPDKLVNPEKLQKKEQKSQQFESFSNEMPVADKDLLRSFYRLIYLQLCDSSDQ